MNAALAISKLTHRYGERLALDNLDLELAPGTCFGLLGPNGSGKTTLFRLLATLLRPQSGTIRLLDLDPWRQRHALRPQLGVVFQAPSLDKLLSVRENLVHHGNLFGLSGRLLGLRVDELLARFGLTQRARDTIGTLSGGLQRRVELARCLLHRPRLLLLDEASTGLDPAARREFWQMLSEVHAQDGVTILFTTHWFEEAENATHLGILDQGHLLACDTPTALKERLGGEVISLSTAETGPISAWLASRYHIQAQLLPRKLRFSAPQIPDLVRELLQEHGAKLDSFNLHKPSLEDVFVDLTGRGFEPVEKASP
jgi:ABC-2 type transport system ATP-binding protein